MRCAREQRSALVVVCALTMAAIPGCRGREMTTQADDRFGADVQFLQRHSTIVVLGDPGGSTARVAVAPAYQGRVMTSTTGGPAAPSFGWIGRAAIEAGRKQPHMNVFGGEDRFWLGPEGGQYALFFKRGDTFDLDHWQTPEPFDWGAWDQTGQSATEVSFRKRMTLENFSGTRFDVDVVRTVRLLGDAHVAAQIGQVSGDVRMVAFESSNMVTNVGSGKWQPESGLLSVWILGQFIPSPSTTIAIPFATGADANGPVVNDKYFGAVPPDRLVVKEGTLFFKGDGQHRSKIGLPPSRALDAAGSYDEAARVLTLVTYTRPPGASQYVNSMWEIQGEPYKGDVVNSYNDGPAAPGKPPLGPFYELETSSPALSLAPGERYTHVHRTIHLSGTEAELDRIARRTLKVGLADIARAFPAR